MNLNQQYIDGSWYEEEYSRKWYRHQYIDTPEPDWAKQSKDYYIGLMIAYAGLMPTMKVLDLGSGVGQVMNAWRRREFHNIEGVEISKTAVEASGDPFIRVGSVADLPYEDKSFDVVTSLALLEHIDESIIDKVLSEVVRVGKRQVHNIGMDKGTDPSHINIKSPDTWLQYFKRNMDADNALLSYLPDPLFNTTPIIIGLYKEEITHPLFNAFNKTVREPIEF